MATMQHATIVGVFEDRRQADRAVAELKRNGFRDDQIGVAMRHGDGLAEGATTVEAGDTYAEEGAATGILAGLGLGALAGVGVLSGVIPVIGPAIAGGTLGILFSNAAAGAAAAGLTGALIGYGIPEEEAQYYEDEFEAGRTVVTVAANGRSDDADAILQRHGAYDVSGRSSNATAGAGIARATAGRGGDTLRVREERLRAETRPEKAGDVTVRKEVRTEHQSIDVPVQREEVVIERTPVHGEACAGSIAGDLREGEQIRIPVREEKVNVSKEAVVTEEVKVGKRVVQDTRRVSGDVRKEEVKVERSGDVDVHTEGKGKKK